jgi:hypothetical protein
MGHSGGDAALKNFSGQFKALADKYAAMDTWADCLVFHNGGDEYAAVCYPPDVPGLVSFMKELALIEYCDKGTEPGYEETQVHSWTRAGAVVREASLMKETNAEGYVCVQEADKLEGLLSSLIDLPRGEGAPPLSQQPWLRTGQPNEPRLVLQNGMVKIEMAGGNQAGQIIHLTSEEVGPGVPDGVHHGGNWLVWSRSGRVDGALPPQPAGGGNQPEGRSGITISRRSKLGNSAAKSRKIML